MASAELAVVRDEPAEVARRDIVDGWVAMAGNIRDMIEVYFGRERTRIGFVNQTARDFDKIRVAQPKSAIGKGELH